MERIMGKAQSRSSGNLGKRGVNCQERELSAAGWCEEELVVLTDVITHGALGGPGMWHHQEAAW